MRFAGNIALAMALLIAALNATTCAFFASLYAMSTTAPAMNFTCGFWFSAFHTRFVHTGNSSSAVEPLPLMSFVQILARMKSTSPAQSSMVSIASIVPPPFFVTRRWPLMPECHTHSSGITAPQMSALWTFQWPFATGAYPAAASFFMRPVRQLP